MKTTHLLLGALLLCTCSAPPATEKLEGETGNAPSSPEEPTAPAQKDSLRPGSDPAPKESPPLPETPTDADAPSAERETLTSSDIRAVMKTLEEQILACFPNGGDWIVPIRFTVEPSGKVSGAAVTDELAGTPAGDCVAAIVKRTSFPAFRGGALRITYPFALGPVIEPAVHSEVPLPMPPAPPVASAPASAPAPHAQKNAPDDPILAAERSLALSDLDGAEAALAPYKSSSNPPPEAVYLLGTIAARRGRVGEMCAYYRQYLALAPRSPAAPAIQKQLDAAAAADPACR